MICFRTTLLLNHLQISAKPVLYNGRKGRWHMPRKFTFKEYWDALNPADPVPLKESILRRAHIDFAEDWPKLKALIDRAYPDPY